MRLIASSLIAGVLALGAVSPALADPQRGHNSREWNDRGRDRHDDRRDNRNDRGWYDNRNNHHDWRRGDRFDRRINTHYVVVNNYSRYNDYYGRRLPAPRRGEYYVRNDNTGEILLIAAATGLVLWALSN